MKSLCFSLFFLLVFILPLPAQIRIGLTADGSSSGTLSAENLEILKKTTTIFIYQESDEETLDELQRILNRVWTLNPIRLVNLEEAYTYFGNAEYSFLIVSSYTSQNANHLSLNLSILAPDKKGKDTEAVSLVRIDLFDDIEYNYEHKGDFAESNMDPIVYIYQKAQFLNWKPGYLKNYFRLINRHLTRMEPLSSGKDLTTEMQLKKLVKDTLFIPDYVLTKRTMTGELEKQDEEYLMKFYPYPYKLLPTEALERRIMASDEHFFYLLQGSSYPLGFMTILDNETAEVVYNEMERSTGIVTRFDMKQLAEKIEKAIKKK